MRINLMYPFIALCSILYGCEKEKMTVADLSAMEEHNQTVTLEKSESITWTIPYSDETIANEINVHQRWDTQSDWNSTLTIEDVPTQEAYRLTLNMGAGQGYVVNTERVVCSGKGISFANCCKSWLDSNPEACLVICGDGSGGYTADDEGC